MFNGETHVSSCGTGKTVSFDPKTNVMVPQDRNGLYAIDNLDPDMVSVFFFF